jgi:hypothetical protein
MVARLLPLLRRSARLLPHSGAIAGLLFASWPALIATVGPAHAGLRGDCELKDTNNIRCIRYKNKDGVLIDITPLASQVSFHIRVMHSACGVKAIAGPQADVTLARDVIGNNPTYRFTQGMTKVYRPRHFEFSINCVEFFIENCRDASGQSGNCSALLDVNGMKVPYDHSS